MRARAAPPVRDARVIPRREHKLAADPFPSFQAAAGNETYFRGGDGSLMPTRKDQPPPDLRYFGKPRASR